MDAWEKFKKTVEANHLVRRGDRVLLAVSGGPDSVCLMHLFWRLRKTLPIELFCLTMDHGLRPESKRETALVQKLGERLSIPVFVEKIPVRSHARSHKLSLETAGRALRYRMLEQTARRCKCAKIATGHHADDNAETMLMWLVRGTGPEGLAGIPLTRPLDEGSSISLIRPLLGLTRRKIAAYLASQRLSSCTDASNLSLDYTRNRIRHRLMPLLGEFNPCMSEHLFSLSRILERENACLDVLVSAALKRSARRGKNTISLDLTRFFRYNEAIRARLLKELVPERCSAAIIERLQAWLEAGTAGTQVLSRAWSAVRTKNKLVFRRTAPQRAPDKP